MFNVLSVSKKLIELSGSSLSNLHINKILYFFYGVYLITVGKPMESPQAWMYGPVFPTVYHRYKRYSIYNVLFEDLTDIEDSEEDAKYISILEVVYQRLKSLTGSDLISLTHKPHSAWVKSYTKGRAVTIQDSLIAEEFNQYLS